MRSLLVFLVLFSFACSQTPTIDDVEENDGEDVSTLSDRPADAVEAEEDEEEELVDNKSKDMAKKSTSQQPLSKDKALVKEKIEQIERESLGDDQKKTLGFYGDLKACRMKLASISYGGSGTLFWDEPGDKLSEKWLSDSSADIKEYQAVLMIVQHRHDYLKSELETCQKDLSGKKQNTSLKASVDVTEGDSDKDERVHQYMCRTVKKGASLRDFLIQSFSRGMLQLENFDLTQELLSTSLKDEKGVSRSNGLMFMGWKLAFDKGPIVLNDLIFDSKDAKLVAWSFKDKEKIKDPSTCLAKAPGLWNP